MRLKGYPEEEVHKARKLVSSFIRSAEEVEEVIFLVQVIIEHSFRGLIYFYANNCEFRLERAECKRALTICLCMLVLLCLHVYLLIVS